MALPKLIKVVIDGVDVSQYVMSYERNRPYTDSIATLDITFTRALLDVIPTIDDTMIGKSITVQRGVLSATEKYVFRGEIRNPEKDGATFFFKCSDKLYETVRTNVTYTFDMNTDDEAGKASEIFKTLITDWTSLTADSSSVQDSGTVFVLKKFFCRDVPVFERLSTLAKAMNWQFYYDPIEDKVFFEPKAYKSSTTVLQVGTNIITTPKWSYNSDKLANIITVRGAEQLVETTEYFSGTNTNDQEAQLSKTPSSVKVYVGSGVYNPTAVPGTRPSDTESNLKTGGKVGSTSGTYYYTYDDDSNVRKINFGSAGNNPNGVPPSGTNNIEVRYTYKLPVPIVGRDQVSIDKYGTHEKTIVKSDLKNVEDAEIFMKKQLAQFKDVFATTKVNVVGLDDLDVGRTYTTIDNNNSINTDFMVTEHTIFHPNTKGDRIVLGDELWKTNDWDVEVWDRLKRLEEQQTETTDLLVDVRTFTRDVKIERRYGLVQKKDRSSDGVNTYILGDPIFGVFGTQELGDAGTALIDYCLVPGNNTYKEFVYDELFYEPEDSDLLASYSLYSNPASAVVSDLSGNVYDGVWKIIATAYYPFRGNALDASESGNDAVVTGATLTTDHLGNADSAYLFTGNNIISVPSSTDFDLTTGVTVSCWVKADWGSTASSFIVGRYHNSDANKRSFLLYKSGNQLRFYTDDGAYLPSSMVGYENQWVHVVGTNDGTTSSVYINGVLDYSVARTLDVTSFSEPVVMGNSTGLVHDFDGSISKVFILKDVCLSSEEVAHLYTVTSSHDLDQPLVTRTDVNGDSITGYDFWTTENYSGGLTCITTTDDVNVSGSFTLYAEVMLVSHSGTGSQYIMAKYNGTAPNNDIYYDTANKRFVAYIRDTAGTAVGVASGHNSVDVNTIYKILVEHDADDNMARMYVDNVLTQEGAGTLNDNFTGTGVFNIGFRRNATDRGFNGVISKPMVINRVLTSDERTQLFSTGALSTEGCVWDTTSETITLQSGGVVMTKAIALNVSYNKCTITLGSASHNNYELWLSADGKSNWQRITRSTYSIINTSDLQGTYLKIINIGDEELIITNEYESGRYKLPAIKVALEE